MKLKSFLKTTTFLEWLCLIIMCYQCYLYVNSVSDSWFNPNMTTDDALQQGFPFHEVHHPGIFVNDIITETMKGCLTPLHYWVSYIITIFTADPIMTGHWVHLIQLVLTLFFIFVAVNAVVGFAPGCLAVTWFVHSGTLMRRITGGLPRGWAPVILSAFIYCILTKRHKTLLFVLLCGCLSNPPVTFICALAYGFYLLALSIRKESRSEGLALLKRLIILAPFYIIVTLAVVHRPDHIGQMVDFKTASAMPEFAKPRGRFPFIPLDSISSDIDNYSMQPIYTSLVRRERPVLQIFDHEIPWRVAIRFIVPFLLIGLCLYGYVKKKGGLPLAMGCMFVAIVCSYLTSRALAFLLFVPNRHLQFPLGIWIIVAFSIVVWRVLVKKPKDSSLKNAYPAVLASLLIAFISWIGVGNGLDKLSNFNYSTTKKGKVFEWFKNNSPEHALVAGHPHHINGIMLFADRLGFVTAEVCHPFYPKFYAEMDRRLRISLKAHYATSYEDFLNLLEPEKIDYFVFAKNLFYPEQLAKASYYRPLDVLVKELASKNIDDYVYKRLWSPDIPSDVVVFRDDQSAVVDVKALRRYIDSIS